MDGKKENNKLKHLFSLLAAIQFKLEGFHRDLLRCVDGHKKSVHMFQVLHKFDRSCDKKLVKEHTQLQLQLLENVYRSLSVRPTLI